MFDRLFDKIRNKWLLFGLSAGVTTVMLLLIFLLFLRPAFAGIFTKQGAQALANGQYEKAQNRYSLALWLNKRDEAAYEGSAKALMGSKDFTKAHQVLDLGIDRISGAESLYLCKAKVYTAQGQIAQSALFLDQIENSYIHKKLQDERPANLIFTPAQGTYSNTQKVTLQQRAGETIYYTLNGENPTTASAVYTQPITVSSTVTLTACAMSNNGLVSPILQITYTIENANESIDFTDPKMEKMVRTALDLPYGPLYAARLSTLTALSSDGIDGQIHSLKDLEYLPALDTLYLEGEFSIDDYTPLSALTNLTSLSLINCGLGDRDFGAVSACSKLTALTVRDNHITTLEPITSLVYLDYLDASQNNLTDCRAVEPLTLLTALDLSQNQLTDLAPLSALEGLTMLTLSQNQLTDLSPLTGLANLVNLSVAGNRPTNIKKLAVLEHLIWLDISECELTSLSVLNDFPALQVVAADDNKIASLSTFKKEVTELYLNRNPLVDFSPLQGQAGLTILEVAGTKINSIDFLAGHPALSILDVADTPITDATLLQTCPQLNLLVCGPTCNTQGLPAQVSIVRK